MARPPLDEKLAEAFRKRAFLSAKRYKFSDVDADDIAQKVLLSFIERRDSKQTVDQAVIDAIRLELGSEYRRNGKGGLNHMTRNRPIEDYSKKLVYKEVPKDLDLNNILLKFEGEKSEHKNNIHIDRDRAIFILYFQWGLAVKEIAFCFDMHETRVSQRLSAIYDKLFHMLKD